MAAAVVAIILGILAAAAVLVVSIVATLPAVGELRALVALTAVRAIQIQRELETVVVVRVTPLAGPVEFRVVEAVVAGVYPIMIPLPLAVREASVKFAVGLGNNNEEIAHAG